MNAYKVDAVVTENGLAILEGLPLTIGVAVEVIVLDNRVNDKDISDEQLTDSAKLDYLDSVSSLMTEWESEADEFAYQDL
jgi:hypothetical protein